MFLDKVTIKVSSGKGGHGANTFRKEKFVAHGGPDGGDGGQGGSVYLEGDANLTTLLDFRYKNIYRADDGNKGARKNQTGKSGDDLVIKVPLGTVVRDPGAELVIADVTEQGQRVLLAQGGRGGRGNTRFKSSRLTVPNFSEPGEPSITRELELELKTIADVGIIGYPNAGKSTLISQLSAAKPKIADYAFTTIAPNLGVVKKQNGDAFVMADIPGLIEGASEGSGLGLQFLRHIERTRFFVHMVDVWGLSGTNIKEHDAAGASDPLHNFIQVNYELFNYSKSLAERKQIVVLNKVEAYPEDELHKLMQRFEEHTGLKFGEQPGIKDDLQFCALLQTSTATGEGLAELKKVIEQMLEIVPKIETQIEIDEDYIATDNDDSDFDIDKQIQSEGNTRWQVSCGKLERVMKLVDIRDLDSLNHLFRITKAIGVIDAVKNMGAQEGDLLNIDGVDFELNEAVLL